MKLHTGIWQVCCFNSIRQHWHTNTFGVPTEAEGIFYLIWELGRPMEAANLELWGTCAPLPPGSATA